MTFANVKEKVKTQLNHLIFYFKIIKILVLFVK